MQRFAWRGDAENWTMTPTIAQLKAQFDAAVHTGIEPLLKQSAAKYRLPLEFVLGIASRETGIRNIAGDGGHGRGVLQIDDRYHTIAATTNFLAHPEVLIDYGCMMLADNLRLVQGRWPSFTSQQHLKITAASYNAGMTGASRGAVEGDADKYTTGHDYGSDVVKRTALFAEILA